MVLNYGTNLRIFFSTKKETAAKHIISADIVILNIEFGADCVDEIPERRLNIGEEVAFVGSAQSGKYIQGEGVADDVDSVVHHYWLAVQVYDALAFAFNCQRRSHERDDICVLVDVF